MDIDETGHHHHARRIDRLVHLPAEAGADMHDPVIGEDQIAALAVAMRVGTRIIGHEKIGIPDQGGARHLRLAEMDLHRDDPRLPCRRESGQSRLGKSGLVF